MMTARGRQGLKRRGHYREGVSLDKLRCILSGILRGTWESALVVTEATSGGPTSSPDGDTRSSAIRTWIKAASRVGDYLGDEGVMRGGQQLRNFAWRG